MEEGEKRAEGGQTLGSIANEEQAGKKQPLHEQLMEIALKRSFLIPSCEIYGASSGFYDYGPIGCRIKKKIEGEWRAQFIVKNGFLEIETCTVLPQIVLQASGHAQNFSDPLVECKKCAGKFRADHLVVQEGEKVEGLSLEGIGKLLKSAGVKCPNCNEASLGEAGTFNLMFATSIGAAKENVAYLRPETAQGIFLDFGRIFRNFGSKLPISIGQVGRSYRNEISPRQALVRMREFTQMEIEYFFSPQNAKMENFAQIEGVKMRIGEDWESAREMGAAEAVAQKLVPNEIMAFFMAQQQLFYERVGVSREKFYFRVLGEKERPHYSLGNIDMEVQTSFGWVETIGNAYRTDFDLSSHAKFSKQDLSVFVEEEKKKVVPHVVEPSMGVDRLFWCILEHAYRGKSKEKDLEWFDLPPCIAPYHASVFPLMKKDGMAEKAQEVCRLLREEGLEVNYSENGNIGKRYERADEVGVCYCISIDYDTLKDGTVTVRFRNDGGQARFKIEELAQKIRDFAKEGKTSLNQLFCSTVAIRKLFK